MRIHTISYLISIFLITVYSGCSDKGASESSVTKVDIESREDWLKGRSFGDVGSYEKLTGTIHFALDPENPRNEKIVDIKLAPRNENGLVEFSADFNVLKPKDPTKGNNTIFFDVANRGNKVALRLFNSATTDNEAGDGFLMAQGYTIVWVGWQFDVVESEDRLRLESPIVTDTGKPIEGVVRYWFRANEHTNVQSLDGPARGTVPYEVTDLKSDKNRLTVREGILEPRQEISKDSWSFARYEDGVLVDDPGSIYLKEGFEPGQLYEVVYGTRNPKIAGLGYAAVRDAVSHFKYDSDLFGSFDQAYAFGSSQSGRFLRGLLYQGFNTDRKRRPVFDGVIANIAGSVRSGFNRRFVQPSVVEPARFPFSDVAQTDPVTGRTDGLLGEDADGPKAIIVNTSNEYWTEWKAAAMVHTSIDGRQDLTPHKNVRVYTIAGAQHGPGSFPPLVRKGYARYQRNSNDFRWALRGLLTALNRWHTEGVKPPDSRHPTLAEKTLVTFDQLNFPNLPDVQAPTTVVGTYRFDDGPRFDQGITDNIPPKLGKPYPVLIPQVDADGNELGGIRLPEIAVPLATYTGWNLRDPDIGAPRQLARLAGSYFPFPRTREERKSTGDPRLAIQSRYKDRSDYLQQITHATNELVKDGFLLEEDAPLIIEKAGVHWDYRMKDTTP